LPAAGRAPHQRGLPRGNAAPEQERAPGDAQANARTFPEQAKSLASHTSPAPLDATPASPARAVTVVSAQFVAGKDDTQQRHSLRDTHPRYAPAPRSLATVAYRRFRSVAEPAAPSGLLLWANSGSGRPQEDRPSDGLAVDLGRWRQPTPPQSPEANCDGAIGRHGVVLAGSGAARVRDAAGIGCLGRRVRDLENAGWSCEQESVKESSPGCQPDEASSSRRLRR
jgi:hypothetical protein